MCIFLCFVGGILALAVGLTLLIATLPLAPQAGAGGVAALLVLGACLTVGGYALLRSAVEDAG